MEKYNYLPQLPEQSVLEINGESLQVYIVEDGTWLFDNRQVAYNYDSDEDTIRQQLYRYKSQNKLIEGKHWFHKNGWKPPRFPHYSLWTKEGFIALGCYKGSTKAEKILIGLGIKTRQATRIESELFKIIKNAFKGITVVETHYQISEYIVDLYFPNLSIIVEIDEMGHENYDSDKELYRESKIRNSSKCEILRFNPHNDQHNIGQVINKILKKILIA